MSTMQIHIYALLSLSLESRFLLLTYHSLKLVFFCFQLHFQMNANLEMIEVGGLQHT